MANYSTQMGTQVNGLEMGSRKWGGGGINLDFQRQSFISEISPDVNFGVDLSLSWKVSTGFVRSKNCKSKIA